MRDAASVAYIWTRAFIANRGWQWVAGWLGFPFAWVVYFCIASAIPGKCLQWRTAAALVQQGTRSRRPIWGSAVLVLAAMVLSTEVIDAAGTSPYWLAAFGVVFLVSCGFVATVADLAIESRGVV